MPFNLALALTWSRLVLTLVLIPLLWVYDEGGAVGATEPRPLFWVWGAFVLAVASLTDFLDGWLARHRNEKTQLGAFLDTLADKFLVCTVLLLLFAAGVLEGLWLLAVLAILWRELLLLSWRGFLIAHAIELPVSKWGKFKAGLQMASLFFLICAPVGPVWLEAFGKFLLVLSVLATWQSAFHYLVLGSRALKEEQAATRNGVPKTKKA